MPAVAVTVASTPGTDPEIADMESVVVASPTQHIVTNFPHVYKVSIFNLH